MSKSVIDTIGELRHRLTFQKPSATKNGNDVIIPGWAPVCTVWGAAWDVSGREFLEAAAHQMEDITTFTIRWRAGLNTSMRIIFQGKPYEIIEINHLSYRGDFLQIKARIVGGEGL